MNAHRVKSPRGTVHQLTMRTRWGMFLTVCGLYFDRGWGPTRDELSCRRCIAMTAKEQDLEAAS